MTILQTKLAPSELMKAYKFERIESNGITLPEL